MRPLLQHTYWMPTSQSRAIASTLPETTASPPHSNSGIEAAGTYSVTRTKVGSPFVIEGMNQATEADETGVFYANGSVLTQSAFSVANSAKLAALPTRDSFLPVLATLSLAKEHGKPLSVTAEDFGLPIIAAADRLENFAVEKSAALMAHLRESPENLVAFLQRSVTSVRSATSTAGG
ncbi:hypothetical protein LH464_08995 [Neorhizobium sp. T786]|uniref:hypothetical protein n=1 Tax=Pseudorhizobium xiangyangii TaxID=2883104 RepID=UPI001D001101|nr:hypothetical protein [Neorhizobium xiangyangii]